MAYTKWVLEPDSLGKYGVHNIVTENGELITSLPPEGKANAQLIASAVTACIKLNPDNPQAVTESISDLHEACKEIAKSPQPSAKAKEMVKQALAKTERK